jgi:hypothetical protein
MTTKTLTADALRHFTGTEQWYRHGLNRAVLYTDGAKFVAETGGAYWLLDTIAICQLEPRVKGEEFQVWKLTVRPNRTATLETSDGNDNIVRTEEIPFTDFPLETITLWFENNVIHLSSEN